MLWLSGPFGRVPADGQLAAGPASPERGLDAWFQSAPLALDTGSALAPLRSWRVTSEDAADAEPVELASGTAPDEHPTGVAFSGPDHAGSYRLVAEAVTADGQELDGIWQIEVPERPFPEDGVLDIPAPVVLLESAGVIATGWAGHGCYIFLCVEIGVVPPASSFESAAVVTGDVMQLRLSDGSGFSLGEVSFTRLDGSDEAAWDGRLESSAEATRQIEMVAPPPGQWLFSLEILYDRERGFSETMFRLVSERPAGQAPTGSGTVSGATGKRDVRVSSGNITPRMSCRARIWAQLSELSK